MFNNLQWIDHVRLQNNKIEHVQTGAFQRIYRAVIDLSWNNIKKIDKTAFRECQNITLLDLSHNKLKEIDDDMIEDSDVHHLLLNHNLLNDTAKIGISNMSSITVLNMSYNLLTNLNRKSFTWQSKKLYELHTIGKKFELLSLIIIDVNLFSFFSS